MEILLLFFSSYYGQFPQELQVEEDGGSLLLRVLSPVALLCVSLLILPIYLLLAFLLILLARVSTCIANEWHSFRPCLPRYQTLRPIARLCESG